MTDTYKGYQLETCCKKLRNGRFSVEVTLRDGDNRVHKLLDTTTSLILQIEAEKESINFGKNAIDNHLIR